MKSLHLHIDRITVDGLSATEQRRFAEELEAQLRTLAAEGFAHGRTAGPDRAITSVSASQLRPGGSAAQAAAQLTDSIRHSMGGRNARNIAGPGQRGGGSRSHV